MVRFFGSHLEFERSLMNSQSISLLLDSTNLFKTVATSMSEVARNDTVLLSISVLTFAKPSIALRSFLTEAAQPVHNMFGALIASDFEAVLDLFFFVFFFGALSLFFLIFKPEFLFRFSAF